MKRKLPPYQYILRFPRWPDHVLPPQQRLNGYLGGAYIVFKGGAWRCYRSRYGVKTGQYYISGATLAELRQRIKSSRDYRYGYWYIQNHSQCERKLHAPATTQNH